MSVFGTVQDTKALPFIQASVAVATVDLSANFTTDWLQAWLLRWLVIGMWWLNTDAPTGVLILQGVNDPTNETPHQVGDAVSLGSITTFETAFEIDEPAYKFYRLSYTGAGTGTGSGNYFGKG